MGIVSFELVPRCQESLAADLAQVKESFPKVGMINIPDLLNFDMRSWEAGCLAKPFYPNVVPHLRAIDFDLSNGSFAVDIFSGGEFDAVLLITGDQPQDMSRRVFRTNVTAMIRALKQVRPGLKVYAGIDPYRSGVKAELDYVQQKLEAGADGFFTQPFFDLRLMDIYHDLLSGLDVFWGVSPVTSARSRDYWENRNQVVFPADFEPTLEWNRSFASQALEFVEGKGGNIYFMPIRVDLREYLDGILS